MKKISSVVVLKTKIDTTRKNYFAVGIKMGNGETFLLKLPEYQYSQISPSDSDPTAENAQRFLEDICNKINSQIDKNNKIEQCAKMVDRSAQEFYRHEMLGAGNAMNGMAIKMRELKD